MLPYLLHPQSPPQPNLKEIEARLSGYQFSENGDLYRRLIQLADGLEKMEWLFDEAVLRLFSDAQVRKGRAYTLAELKSIAQPQAQTPQFYVHLQDMLRHKLFFRGYNLTCPFCGLTTWYDWIVDGMGCDGCGAGFQPPLEVPFAFKPNHLLTEALKSGALTVLLFLHQLRSVSEQALWGADYRLRKDGQETELDLITLVGDVLTVVECKDDFSDATATLAQLERGLAVAYELDADAFIFATLKPDPPDVIRAFCSAEDDRLLRRFMDRNALLGSLAYWKA